MSAKKREQELNNIRMLVVDDDAAVRSVLDKALTGQGADVTLAVNGRDGLEQILKSDFDVLLVDIRMEGMDGFTFLVEALRIRPWLAVVIISGYLDDDVADRARELGVEQMLDKPIDMKTLAQAIQTVYAEKANVLAMPAAFSMDRFRYELETLRRLTRAAVEAATMQDALWKFAHGLGDVLQSPALGLCILDEHPTLLISERPGCPPEAEKAIENSIRLRYRALSGEELPTGLRIETEALEGPEIGDKSPLDVHQTIPILQDGKVVGLVSLVTDKSEASSDRGTAFLYHAANHLATVLFAFRRTRAMAITDELTGLYNRRHLLEQIAYLTNLCARYRMPLSIALLDIDNFKQINDDFGHLAGDNVLRTLCSKLRSVTRKADIVARYGGDEIAFVLPNTALEGARTWACRMLAEIAGSKFEMDEELLQITATIGVTTASPAPKASLLPSEFLEQADKALRAAKTDAKSHYVLNEMPNVGPNETHFE